MTGEQPGLHGAVWTVQKSNTVVQSLDSGGRTCHKCESVSQTLALLNLGHRMPNRMRADSLPFRCALFVNKQTEFSSTTFDNRHPP